MCAGDYYRPEQERMRVTQGLPPCLTQRGIEVVEFKPGTSYHQQQAALVALSRLSLNDSPRDDC